MAAKRTPFGRYRGFFKEQSATDLGVLALTKTLEAIDLDPAEVEGVFMGNVIAAGLGENMARQVALRSGLSETTVATTVNDVCGSSLKALRLAQGQMMMGDLDLVAVGGSESMTNAPFIVDKKYKDDAQNHLQNSMLVDALIDAFSGEHMGITAENVAEEYNIALAADTRGYYIITTDKEYEDYMYNLESRIQGINKRKNIITKNYKGENI